MDPDFRYDEQTLDFVVSNSSTCDDVFCQSNFTSRFSARYKKRLFRVLVVGKSAMVTWLS